jgi:hypothetical protein
MVSGLSRAEREQLIALLSKLYRSLRAASQTTMAEAQGG